MKHYPVSTRKFCEGKIYIDPTTHWQARARHVDADVINPEIDTGRSEFPGIVTRCRYMEIPNFQLEQILSLGAELGAITTLIQIGELKPYLKKSEAFRLYGRKNIEHWINKGWVTPRKDGEASAAWRLSRLEIEVLVKAIALRMVMAGLSETVP